MIKLILLGIFLYAMPAQSITCVKDYGGENSCVNNQDTAGDCAILGYSTENVKDCAQYLRCPFNSDYKICVSGATSSSIDCATLGFTQDDKSTWCAPDKIIKCPTNESLTLCNGVNTEVMDCASLGFTSSDKTETCPADKIVTCPTDSSLTICTEPGAKPINCAELGFTQDDKSEWCSKGIVKCPEDNSYTLCSQYSPCTYQYDIATYPNVRDISKNDSCKRGGITYYRDICEGVTEASCSTCFTQSCYSYNGTRYGVCDPCDHQMVLKLRIPGIDAFSSNAVPSGTYLNISVVITSEDGSQQLTSAFYQIKDYEFQRAFSGYDVDIDLNFDRKIRYGKYRIYLRNSGYWYGYYNFSADIYKFAVNGKTIYDCSASPTGNIDSEGNIIEINDQGEKSVLLALGHNQGCRRYN